MTSSTQAASRSRPILFSSAMIRALLDGRKTQTRRVVKPQPVVASDGCWSWSPHRAQGLHHGQGGSVRDMLQCLPPYCPYGVPGDVLWARESWTRVPASAYRMSEGVQQTIDPSDPDMAAIYAAGWERSIPKWRPSIHMPRWASRLMLEITDIRVERLQDISEEDAQAEGVGEYACPGPHRGPGATYFTADPTAGEDMPISRTTPIAAYKALWEHINGCGSWDANPWVWVLTFTVHHQNVDTFLKTHEAAQ